MTTVERMTRPSAADIAAVLRATLIAYVRQHPEIPLADTIVAVRIVEEDLKAIADGRRGKLDLASNPET